MDRGDTEAQARELAYEFEVKEQDRWLPIANGWPLPGSMKTFMIMEWRTELPIVSGGLVAHHSCL